MPDKDNSHPPTRLTWGEVKRIYEDCQARGVPPPLKIVRVIEPIVKKAEELSKTFNAIERSMSYAKVAFFGFIYQKTSNPLYVWQCIKLCLERGLTLPKWAQSYLR
jgi:hypothetical protein